MGNTDKEQDSKVYGIDKWREIRERVNDKNDKYGLIDKTSVDDWNDAVAIFSRRLMRFYINPINKLIPGITGEGFIIVTAQCALIETFAAFKEGKVYNREKDENEIYYNASKDLFVKFLTKELIFEGIFHNNQDQINCPHSAERFYSKVRCGLMHEARTKDEWIIHKEEENYARNNPRYKKTGKFIKEKSNKKIIFRNQLQKSLEKYFEQYKEDLRNKDEANNNLRRLFARKLDDLFDVEDIEGYEWWN
jgi:hypothetical protein